MANPAENNVKNESPMQENKMGVMPVGKLLFSMSLPIMISMLVQALYNVVDSMFVARVSENALTALSMAFPIQNLMIAVSTGLGVGLNAVLSRALGAKDEKGVNRAATNGIMLLFICGLIFMIGGVTIVRPYFEMQTDIEEIVKSGIDYTTIVMVGSMGVFMTTRDCRDCISRRDKTECRKGKNTVLSRCGTRQRRLPQPLRRGICRPFSRNRLCRTQEKKPPPRRPPR